MISENNLAEYTQKIQIDDLVRQVNKEVKHQILQSHIEIMGLKLNLLTSTTRFNGRRYWFACPICGGRVGTLYKHPLTFKIGCRICLKMRYKKQRFKGMIEGNNVL